MQIMTQKQERFVRMVINIILEKNGCYMPSSLGSRLISVGRQASVRRKILCRFMVLIAQQKEIYGLHLKDMLLLPGCFPRHSEAIVFLIDHYYQVLTYLKINQLGSYVISEQRATAPCFLTFCSSDQSLLLLNSKLLF